MNTAEGEGKRRLNQMSPSQSGETGDVYEESTRRLTTSLMMFFLHKAVQRRLYQTASHADLSIFYFHSPAPQLQLRADITSPEDAERLGLLCLRRAGAILFLLYDMSSPSPKNASINPTKKSRSIHVSRAVYLPLNLMLLETWSFTNSFVGWRMSLRLLSNWV